jgi:hypothetical protein
MDFKNLPINNSVLAKANLNLIYFPPPPAKAGGNSAGGNSAGGNSAGGNSAGGNSRGNSTE